MSDNSVKHLSDEWLQEYLDDELDDPSIDLLHEHLASCATCQQKLEAWRSLFAEIEHVPELEPSMDLAPVILARLESSGKRRSWNPWFLLGQAILAIALLAYGWMRLPSLIFIDRFRMWISTPWQTVENMINQLFHTVMSALQQITTWTPSSGDLIANIPQIPAERTLLIYLGFFLIILWLAINRSLLKVNGQSRDIRS